MTSKQRKVAMETAIWQFEHVTSQSVFHDLLLLSMTNLAGKFYNCVIKGILHAMNDLDL